MSYRFKKLAAILAVSLLTLQARAATLVGPASVVPPGETFLSAVDLGTPNDPLDTFWIIEEIEWEQSETVQIQVGVFTPDGDDGSPVEHNIIMTTRNLTPDLWDGFDISIAGPATVITGDPLFPVTVNRLPADPPDVTDTTISFGGMAWPPTDFSTFTFGLNVTPPVSGEPIVITLSPSAVPEPSGAAILMIGGLMVLNRRRKRA